ncbi:MAG: ribosome small subunit-dependent GTPase A [Bacteroidales bacterium]|jgi:ribosome biogenesis GTPase
MSVSILTGTVIKTTGSYHNVRIDTGEVLICGIKGLFRMKGIRTTNPVAVGDRVDINTDEHGKGIIVKIHQRKNYIIRKAINLARESHILAANIDQAFLMITLKAPVTLSMFADRFLVTAEAYSVPVILIFNKTDLYGPEEMGTQFDWINAYTLAGYPCHTLSLVTGKGLEEIRHYLPGKITLISGNSGVGKSTLINSLDPLKKLKTSVISVSNKSGKHTTTFPEMVELASGGNIIDTPGIRGFGMLEIDKNELYHYFPEIFKHADTCQFYNCSHTHEPGCSVREAVENGLISEMRFMNYLGMMEGVNNKYR